MKKILLILTLLLCSIGCSSNNSTKNKITSAEAYNNINEVFKYDEAKEEYDMEYYKQVRFEVNGKEEDYHAFLITSKTSNYKYYVLIDIYGENIINPVSIEDIE